MESAVAAPSHNRHDQASNEKSENKGEEVHSVATSRCELCQEILGKNPKHLTEAVKGNFLKMIKVHKSTQHAIQNYLDFIEKRKYVKGINTPIVICNRLWEGDCQLSLFSVRSSSQCLNDAVSIQCFWARVL